MAHYINLSNCPHGKINEEPKIVEPSPFVLVQLSALFLYR